MGPAGDFRLVCRGMARAEGGIPYVLHIFRRSFCAALAASMVQVASMIDCPSVGSRLHFEGKCFSATL